MAAAARAALGGIKRLRELAIECEGDKSKFSNLAHEIKDGEALVSALGPHALDHLNQLRQEFSSAWLRRFSS